MQENLTKEVEILTTIVSLEHAKSSTMLSQNKVYLEKKESSLQNELNALMKSRAITLRKEVKKLYKAKLARLEEKKTILAVIRQLLQKRYLMHLPKEQMVASLMKASSEHIELKSELNAEKAAVKKDEKILSKLKGGRSAIKAPTLISDNKILRKDKKIAIENYETERKMTEDTASKLASAEDIAAPSTKDVGEAVHDTTRSILQSKLHDLEHKLENGKPQHYLAGNDGDQKVRFEEEKLTQEGEIVDRGEATPKMLEQLHLERSQFRQELAQAGRNEPGFLKPKPEQL
jgi:hypothetical protein